MNSKQRLTDKNIIMLIIGAGILVRALYVIFMPVVNFAQYDIGTVDLDNNVLTGHLGYIFYLFKNHSFVPFDPREIYQFNHPPIHYIICALWVSFINIFTDNTQTLIESVQFITLIYSAVTLFAFERLLTEIDAPQSGKMFALFIVAFQPTLIMTAGSVNNDGIGLMFQVLAMWFAIKWYKSRTLKDILGIALFVSTGMLSKLSAGLVAFPIAVMFLYVFIKDWITDKKFPVKTMIRYILFGIVCVPIGLLWVLRCYFKFGMPPTYIAFLPETSEQYIGNYSRFERLFFPNPVEVAGNLLHGRLGMGWNIWMQMFRTSALGECDLASFSLFAKAICLLTVLLNFAIAVWAFVMFVKAFVIPCFARKEGRDLCLNLFFVTAWLIMMYSYFSFADTYPHECSMNFRYVQLAMLPPLVAWAKEKTSFKKTDLAALLYSAASLGVLLCWCTAY